MMPFKSIRVGPFDLQVKLLSGEDRDKCLGMFSETQMAILMRETYATGQQEGETFLHELLHAIWCVFGCKPKDNEERIISQMSIGLAQVMCAKENEPMLTWLREKLS